VTPEQKKHLLYGGGALASIAALVLFMKNKSAPGNMPISGAGMGGGMSGAGGPSAGTSANNSAALNAAVALAVEQSRQSNALDVARLQSSTALSIAGLQAQSAKDQANAKTAQAALGPGGAVTAAAPVAAKGLFDAIQKGIDDFFKNRASNSPFVGNPTGGNILDTDNPNDPNASSGVSQYGYSLYPESTQPGYYVMNTPQQNYGMPDFTSYVAPASYGDYFQGSTGSGDSGYTGSTPTDFGGSGGGTDQFNNPDYYNPAPE
jgi:hypothetical protein